MGIRERIADARLGGQVCHPLRFGLVEQGWQFTAVRDIQFEELEVTATLDLAQTCQHQFHGVIGAQVGHAENLFTTIQKAFGQVESNETSTACDENSHINKTDFG